MVCRQTMLDPTSVFGLSAPGAFFPDRNPQFAAAFEAGFTVRVGSVCLPRISSTTTENRGTPVRLSKSTTRVDGHLPERGLKEIPVAHVAIQAPCFPLRLALGLPVSRPLQLPNSRRRFRHRGCCQPLQAITPFSDRLARVCTTAPPSLHSHCSSFFTTIQDSDGCLVRP